MEGNTVNIYSADLIEAAKKFYNDNQQLVRYAAVGLVVSTIVLLKVEKRMIRKVVRKELKRALEGVTVHEVIV